MKLRDIYNTIIEEGIKHDPRGKKGVYDYLKKVKKDYGSLNGRDKKAFDREKLNNPFSDTRILYGDHGKDMKNIMVGIDIEGQEVLLADSLRRKGKKIDLLLSHHPEGFARSIFYEVMNVQLDILKGLGVSPGKAKKLLDERMAEVMRKILAGNAMRSVDTARLLKIPMMCVHTPADNFVSEYINKLINRNKPKTVGDLIDILLKEPEYKHAVSVNAGPKMILGDASNRCGKIAIEMTGGTEGPKKIFPEMAKAGVKTIVGMHMSEDHYKKAKKHNFNVLVAGHISSDNIGLNLLLDSIDKNNRLNIIPCSGFIRVRRN
ncbi:MAG: NGG1p interacting factor NIF3 [Candidatus Omnitrophota bacterium]